MCPSCFCNKGFMIIFIYIYIFTHTHAYFSSCSMLVFPLANGWNPATITIVEASHLSHNLLLDWSSIMWRTVGNWSYLDYRQSGWWQLKHFLIFAPKLGEMIPFWRAYFFRWIGSTTNQSSSNLSTEITENAGPIQKVAPSSVILPSFKVLFVAPRTGRCWYIYIYTLFSSSP